MWGAVLRIDLREGEEGGGCAAEVDAWGCEGGASSVIGKGEFFGEGSAGFGAAWAPFDRVAVCESTGAVDTSSVFSVIEIFASSCSAEFDSFAALSSTLTLRFAVPRRPLGILDAH